MVYENIRETAGWLHVFRPLVCPPHATREPWFHDLGGDSRVHHLGSWWGRDGRVQDSVLAPGSWPWLSLTLPGHQSPAELLRKETLPPRGFWGIPRGWGLQSGFCFPVWWGPQGQLPYTFSRLGRKGVCQDRWKAGQEERRTEWLGGGGAVAGGGQACDGEGAGLGP